MKKKEKYYAVNKQEDEDGYTLHPANAIIDGNIKSGKYINSFTSTVTTGSGSSTSRNLPTLQSSGTVSPDFPPTDS
jgi:hypothetical protein